MKVPTLQELQRGFQLTQQQKLILFIASGEVAGHVARRHGWNSLRDLGLLDENFQLTLAGKMELSRIKEKKIIKIKKNKRN